MKYCVCIFAFTIGTPNSDQSPRQCLKSYLFEGTNKSCKTRKENGGVLIAMRLIPQEEQMVITYQQSKVGILSGYSDDGAPLKAPDTQHLVVQLPTSRATQP